MDNKYDYFSPSNKLYMVVIAILITVIFFCKEFTIGFVAVIVYGILVVYNLKKSKLKKDEWIKFIENFSSKLDVATRNTLVKLPFPLIMVNNKGKILWYNQNASLMIEGEEILGQSINSIIKEFNVRLILDEKKNIFKQISIKDRYYNLYTSIVDTVDKETTADKVILAYFYDVTEMVRLEKYLKDNKESVILIEVDNMDEVVKTTEEDKKPLLIAEIERTINSYAQNLNSMIKKYSSNKYVITVQDKYIEQEIEKKFDILDNIRELSIGNKLSVTLSMGVGRGGETPLENYNLAMSAKDLALGRGGDQVVIKVGDKLSFFGGKTKEVEKRTKVRARVIAHALRDLINESSKVYIMGHKNPDIDCLGAAIGLHSVVRYLNKECYIVLDSNNNAVKHVLDKFKDEEEYQGTFINGDTYNGPLDENSLMILVDVHSKNYVQNYELIKDLKKIVIIDHHRKSTAFIEGALLSYIETYASSTSELVTEMLQYMIEKPKLKRIEAEALLAGICVDTKNFYFKTGVRTFEAAGFLRRLGADTIDVKKMFSDDLTTYINRAEILKAAQVENNIAIAICPPHMQDTVLAAQAADELLNITGIQASFVLVKIEDEVFISGRSLGEINVQLILEALGGGGHMTIAGARLEALSLEEVLSMLKSAIDKYLMEGEKK